MKLPYRTRTDYTAINGGQGGRARAVLLPCNSWIVEVRTNQGKVSPAGQEVLYALGAASKETKSPVNS